MIEINFYMWFWLSTISEIKWHIRLKELPANRHDQSEATEMLHCDVISQTMGTGLLLIWPRHPAAAGEVINKTKPASGVHY